MRFWAACILCASLAAARPALAAQLPVATPPAAETALVVELQAQASASGPEATFEQVCRWPADAAGDLQPFAQVVVARCQRGGQFAPLELQQLRGILEGAGLNLATVRFSGATRCQVQAAAASATVPAPSAPAAEKIVPAPAPAPAPVVWPSMAPAVTETPHVEMARPAAPAAEITDEPHSLRDLLLSELSSRCRVPLDNICVEFPPQAENYLGLQEAEHTFVIGARHNGLGAQSWDIQITKAGRSERVTISASARAWENRLVLLQPLSSRQVIRETDLEQRRVLTERLTPDLISNPAQVIGQIAARDLRAGTVMTSYLISPVPLVHAGQIVNLTTRNGGVQVTTIAKAIDSGTYGQIIKVRNDASKAVLEVKVTGPQAAEVN